jgi:predicted nuclease of predicted toxin-antitoxin system
MRFLADENFPGDAVTALRTSGHDVLWIRTDAPGITDQDVLARSLKDARVLLTFDKDFGELAWRSGLPATCGIVLFRLPARSVRQVSARSSPMFSRHATIGPGILCCRAWPDSGARASPTRVVTIDGKSEISWSCNSDYSRLPARYCTRLKPVLKRTAAAA